MSVLIEACLDNLDAAIAAEAGGADRIELNLALELDGLTPSVGLLKTIKNTVSIPIVAMVRPRAAGFCYSEADFAVMQHDLDRLLEAGADGVVFGILDAHRRVDVARCRLLMQQVGSQEIVFHRAFDVVPDASAALETLIQLGFHRILTSGQQPTAPEGAPLIKRVIEQARGRIEILPGAGIRAENVNALIQTTGCTQVHSTFSQRIIDPSTQNQSITFGGDATDPHTYLGVDADAIRRLRAAVDAGKQT